MSKHLCTRCLVGTILSVSLIFLVSSCSSDDAGPTVPGGDDTPANTPALPVVANPLDHMPSTSDTLEVEMAALGNFTPDIAALTTAQTAALNEAHAVDFQLPAGRNTLVAGGRAFYPENLQWSTGGTWHPLTRTMAPAPFVELGTFGGNHYYLAQSPTRWIFADVNCRNFGGHLASITSVEESGFVRAQVQAVDPALNYFIGMTDWGFANGDWIWTCGEACGWFNWNPGEPNNSGGEQFVHVLPTGLWNDTTINFRAPYVLERATPLPDLGDGDIPCAAFTSDLIHLDNLAGPSVMPHVERRIYWDLVFDTTLSSGATYQDEQHYEVGTSETHGESFGWSIGIEASLGWGPATVSISSEFRQDFNHEVTISESSEHVKTYTYTAPAGKTVKLALWQLREVFVIVDSEGNDWEDPRFVLNGEMPVLDHGLPQEYLQTIVFDNP